MLGAASFEQIEESSFRRSRVAELRGTHFDNRPVASLYVEARR